MSCFVLPGNTPQYLIQMKSEPNKTINVFSDWSPKLINNVCLNACVHVHTQFMKTYTELGQCDTPQFLSQMDSDFDETWYDLQVGIKNAPTKIGSNTCMHTHTTCTHFFYNQ